MRRFARATVSAFSSYVKNMKLQPPVHQLYNQNLSFTCKDYYTKFILGTPNHVIGQRRVLYIKTSKALMIKSVHIDQKFTKGALYTGYSLNLRQLTKFLSWDFKQGEKFVLGDQIEGLEIAKVIPEAQQNVIKQVKVEERPKEDEKKKKKSSQNSEDDLLKQMQGFLESQPVKTPVAPAPIIRFSIKSKLPPLTFQMKENTFSSLRKTLRQSLPYLYGTNSEYDIGLENLMSRVENGQIQDEEQAEYNNFRL